MKNIKKLIALLSVVCMAVGFCACSQTPEIPKDPYDQLADMFGEANVNNVETEPETTVPQFVGYESENIEIFGESYELKDRVAKFVDDRYQVAQDKDGKFFTPYDGYDVFRDEDIVDYWFTRDYEIYKDSDGICHADGYDDYLFTEVKGEIFYAFYSSFAGEFFVLSKDTDGTMYISAFNESGSLAQPEKYNNTPLYANVLLSEKEDRFCKVDKIEVGDNGYFYIEANGKKYYYNFNSIDYFYGVPSFNTKEMTADADKVYDFGYHIGTNVEPIYSKKNDTTALYYIFRGEEFAIKLVDGYTVNDIKKVIVSDNVVMLMNDSSVYTGTLENNIIGTKLVKHEEASKLGAEGKIIDITVSDRTSFPKYILVCDDNCLYELK